MTSFALSGIASFHVRLGSTKNLRILSLVSFTILSKCWFFDFIVFEIRSEVDYWRNLQREEFSTEATSTIQREKQGNRMEIAIASSLSSPIMNSPEGNWQVRKKKASHIHSIGQLSNLFHWTIICKYIWHINDFVVILTHSEIYKPRSLHTHMICIYLNIFVVIYYTLANINGF